MLTALDDARDREAAVRRAPIAFLNKAESPPRLGDRVRKVLADLLAVVSLKAGQPYHVNWCSPDAAS
jgi:hypothetical protein